MVRILPYMSGSYSPAKLMERAEVAQSRAYKPYSDYAVGVAVETASGEIYIGCNVENVAYTPTTHAEQNAITSAIADGHTEFVQMALITTGEKGVPPCGFCRQVIREFCADDFPIHVSTSEGYDTYTLGELLPESFGPEHIKSDHQPTQ